MIPIERVEKLDPARLLRRDAQAEADVSAAVDEVIEAVRTRGDEALRDYTRRFDGAELTDLRVTEAEIQAAWEAITSGSWPNSCTATWDSPSASASRCRVFSLAKESPLADTISVKAMSAPASRHSVRKAMSDTPAMGASSTRCFPKSPSTATESRIAKAR